MSLSIKEEEGISRKNIEEKVYYLNKQIMSLIDNRTKYIEDNSKYFAEYQVGEKLYNILTGKIGIVSAYTRQYADGLKLYDSNFNIGCVIQEYEGVNIYETIYKNVMHPYVRLTNFLDNDLVYCTKKEFLKNHKI